MDRRDPPVYGQHVEDLARLMADAELFLQSHGLSPRTVYDVHLVLEEVLTNIVKYGLMTKRPRNTTAVTITDCRRNHQV